MIDKYYEDELIKGLQEVGIGINGDMVKIVN